MAISNATKSALRDKLNDEYQVDAPKNKLHVEWNLNRFVKNPSIINNTDALSKRQKAITDRIRTHLGPEKMLEPNRAPGSAYIVQGTNYYNSTFRHQRSRSESSWHNDTSWLLFGEDARFKYFVSPFKSNDNGNLPLNAGRIVYTWPGAKPANKIFIQFNNHSAVPSNWSIEIDVGNGWENIATNPGINSDGQTVLWRQTTGNPNTKGTWGASPDRWQIDDDNHVNLTGIRVIVNSITRRNARLEIIELSPRLEANLSELLSSWNVTNEMADADYIAPIGTASANTGQVVLLNDTGIFDEQDEQGIFYEMFDEQVEFRLFLDYGLSEDVQMFCMYSTNWAVAGRGEATVTLADKAGIYQNIKCPDILMEEYTAGSALHFLFAMLGLPQFNMVETEPKESPVIKYFYTKREDTLWQIIQDVCRSLQLAAFFDETGQLQIYTKEAAFNPQAPTELIFYDDDRAGQLANLLSEPSRQEATRYNKVTVRYSALVQLSPSGGKLRHLWDAPDDYTLGAAQIIENIKAGDRYFRIDPGEKGDSSGSANLPNWSSRVAIEHLGLTVNTAGQIWYCENAPEGERRVLISDLSDFLRAREKNNGKAPRFSGYIKLDDDSNFNKDVYTRNYSFRQDWNIIEYTENSAAGQVINTSVHQDAYKGAMKFTTNYAGAKRLVVSRKNKDWDRFDRVGVKMRFNEDDHKAGLVIWPQGSNGQAGYYFVVSPGPKDDGDLSDGKKVKKDDKGPSLPTLRGWRVGGAGGINPLDARVVENTKDVPNIHFKSWVYLEAEIWRVGDSWEFDIYVDGQYFKTYYDNVGNLSRNEVAGLTFLGSGSTLVDRFYVINYPPEAVRQNDKDEHGWVVRRQDLWRDRKASKGDKLFEKYLRWIENKENTEMYDYEFSGRTHAVAREKVTEKVRFELPALTARFYRSNHAVDLVNMKKSSFGAKFTIINHSEKPQLLKGDVQTRVESATRHEGCWIEGESLWTMDPQEIEYKSSDSIDRIGPLPLEFEGPWLQDHYVAKNLAKWVQDRFEVSSEVYTFDVFGNPTISVGDVVQISYPLRGFQQRINGDPVKWVIQSVEQRWENGLTTSVRVRRIAV